MTVVTVKDRTDTQVLLARLQTWQRDAKKYGQTALYDLLHETCTHIRQQEKALADTGRETVETFTHNEADAAFFLVSTYLHFMPNTRKQMKTLMQSRIGDLYHIILLHPDDAELHDFFRDTFIQIGNTDDGEKVLQDLDMRGFDAVSQEDMEFMIDLMETLKD